MQSHGSLPAKATHASCVMRHASRHGACEIFHQGRKQTRAKILAERHASESDWRRPLRSRRSLFSRRTPGIQRESYPPTCLAAPQFGHPIPIRRPRNTAGPQACQTPSPRTRPSASRASWKLETQTAKAKRIPFPLLPFPSPTARSNLDQTAPEASAIKLTKPRRFIYRAHPNLHPDPRVLEEEYVAACIDHSLSKAIFPLFVLVRPANSRPPSNPIHLHGESANGGGRVQGDAERVRPQQRPRAAAVHHLPRQAHRGHLAHGRGGVRERVLLRRRDPVVAGGDDPVRPPPADGGAGRDAHPAGGVRGLPPRHRAALHGRDLPPALPQLQQLQPRGGAVPHRRRRARLHPQPPRRGHVQPHGTAHHAHDPEPRVHAPEQQRAAGHAVRAHARIRLRARAVARSCQARSAGASARGEGFEGSSLFSSAAGGEGFEGSSLVCSCC